MHPLISVADLHARIARDADDLRVVDARFSLADVDAGRRAYLAGHLPGAVYLHLDHDLSGPLGAHGGRHPLPTPEAAAETFARAGIDARTHVVAYDGGDGMTAARVWWMLRWLGVERVQVLDGGLPAWRDAGHALATDVRAPSPRRFVPDVQGAMVVDRDWVMDHLGDPSVALIDARAAERFRGDVEPLDPRAGHVPGAVNLPFQGNLAADGRFADPATLRARYAEVAAAPTVVAYCGSGVSAAHDLLALELAGVRGAKLYAGSWSDWVSYSDAPVETGGGPGTVASEPTA